MDTDGTDPAIGNEDDVARLVALTERQHLLWGELRDAQGDELRNRLFDELSANREELARLKERVSAQVDDVPTPTAPPIVRTPGGDPAAVTQPESEVDETPSEERPKSVGETLRANLLTPPDEIASTTPPPPPPPTTRPPVVDEPVSPPDTEAPFASYTTPEEPVKPPQPSPDAPPVASGLGPEQRPFSSREADLAATRERRDTSAVRPPKPDPKPDYVGAPPLEEKRKSAHQRYEALERVRPEHNRRFPIFALVVAVLALVATAWFLFLRSDGSSDPVAGGTTTTTVPNEASGASKVDQIRAVLDGLGYGSVMVEDRSGTIFLAGVVASESDRAAAIGASAALAGGATVDSSGVSIGVVDQDLRAVVLAAIAAAGYDKINVTVSGSVATLTGVTPSDGAADLISAVTAVNGIEQVVDLTETSDRAAALGTELKRITSVSPIVFESGQTSLNALQERILDSAAEIIQAYGGPIVTVVGYTDATGTPENNERISLTRAQRVVDYLVAQGVAPDRLVIDARGEESSSGSSAVAGLERRVEFEVGYSVITGGDGDFRIGIVAPSARDDLAFTQSIVDAVDVIAQERGGVLVDISDGLFVTDEATAAIRGYAAEGYDLVIAHGSQYGTSLATIAPEFPTTAFAWGTAADTFDIPNVSAYEVSSDQGGYVMGVVAALLTENDSVGVVGPLEVGDAKLFVDGFRTGVLTTNPGADVTVTYTGSFSDVALAAETASAHIAAGADVLTGSAQMVVGAVGVATENDALWFGTQANQSELAPNNVVASQVYHWEFALRQIVAGIEQGVLGGSTYTLTLANGGLVIEYNPNYSVPADVLGAAQAAEQGIISGTVSTGS